MSATRNDSFALAQSTRPSPLRSGSTRQHHSRGKKNLPPDRNQVGRRVGHNLSCRCFKLDRRRRGGGRSGHPAALAGFPSEVGKSRSWTFPRSGCFHRPLQPPFPPSLSTLNSHATCLKLVDTLRIAPERTQLPCPSLWGNNLMCSANQCVGAGYLRVVLQQTISAIMGAQSTLIKGHLVSHQGQIGSWP